MQFIEPVLEAGADVHEAVLQCGRHGLEPDHDRCHDNGGDKAILQCRNSTLVTCELAGTSLEGVDV